MDTLLDSTDHQIWRVLEKQQWIQIWHVNCVLDLTMTVWQTCSEALHLSPKSAIYIPVQLIYDFLLFIKHFLAAVAYTPKKRL